MKNYAGHRLSPWLGHLMVSRTETARQLLTPGEVMQLPDDEEIVMIAGLPPIRAHKARYFTDKRFTERVGSPPEPQALVDAEIPLDDWSGPAPVKAPTSPKDPSEDRNPSSGTPEAVKDGSEDPEPEPKGSQPAPEGEAAKAENSGDPANSGIRREPDLPDHEEIAPEPAAIQNEFEFDDDIPENDAARTRQAIDQTVTANARRASLDPDDGIEL